MTCVSHILRAGLLATAIGVTGCSMAPMAASTTTTTVGATLSSAAEVPPNSSSATGKLDATFDKGTSVLRWTLSYSGLSGPASAAHFHGPALPGSNAGVAVPFTSAASPSDGQATLTPPQVADLMAGKWYVNVHTAANPGGEIRGQVMVK